MPKELRLRSCSTSSTEGGLWNRGGFDDMHSEWIAAEHHRLHIIEEWPESPHKKVALAAIQSSLHSLLQNHPPDGPLAACEICLSRKKGDRKIRILREFDLKQAARSAW